MSPSVPYRPVEMTSQWSSHQHSPAHPTLFAYDGLHSSRITHAHSEASSRMPSRRPNSYGRKTQTQCLSRAAGRERETPHSWCGSHGKASHTQSGSRRIGRTVRMERWDGRNRTHVEWDSLRRDLELWYPQGDCLVYLYEEGHSQRGASFCVSSHAIRQRQCGALLDRRLDRSVAVPIALPTQENVFELEDAGNSPPSKSYDLHLPVPQGYARDQAFLWHVTTRNLFAWICGKPLVGVYLGTALVELRTRLESLRGGGVDNAKDFQNYMADMGYLRFTNCPEYAIAALYYAERFEDRELWADAFAHCVGMNDLLYMASGFELISERSKVLITRAYLEMEVHLSHVSKALSNFLEDDLSDSHFGLPRGARQHLESFRSFVTSYYVAKLGYWPPSADSGFSKPLYRSMYSEFRNLYDFLVDADSTNSLDTQKLPSGGICVLQNVQAFDRRHRFVALPHPLPLVPEPPKVPARNTSQRALLSLRVGTKQAKSEHRKSIRATLAKASNAYDRCLTTCPLVRSYVRFERDWSYKPEEKVSLQDARKVRWVLIYAVLQMLVSVVRAPKEVRTADDPNYPLCCLIPEMPKGYNWTNLHSSMQFASKPSPTLQREALSASMPVGTDDSESRPPSIHPDCENDEDFLQSIFVSKSGSSTPSSKSASGSQMKKSSSSSSLTLRDLRRLSLPVLSRRSGISKQKIPTRSSTFSEIFIHGYGNGLNPAKVIHSESASSSGRPNSMATTDYQTFQSYFQPSTDAHPSDCSTYPISATQSETHAFPNLDDLAELEAISLSTPADADKRASKIPDRSNSITSSRHSGASDQHPSWSSRASSASSATSGGGDSESEAVANSPRILPRNPKRKSGLGFEQKIVQAPLAELAS